MEEFRVVIKDINDAGGAVYENGEPAILAGHMNYLPRLHDIMKFEGVYYEVIRVIYNFDDCDDPITIVVRKYVIEPLILEDHS